MIGVSPCGVNRLCIPDIRRDFGDESGQLAMQVCMVGGARHGVAPGLIITRPDRRLGAVVDDDGQVRPQCCQALDDGQMARMDEGVEYEAGFDHGLQARLHIVAQDPGIIGQPLQHRAKAFEFRTSRQPENVR